jgi:Uma2 family endonuclease
LKAAGAPSGADQDPAAEDYLKLSEGTRAELIEGEICRSPSPEYWIVDPAAETAQDLRLAAAALSPHGYFERDDPLASPALPGFALPVREIFA